MYSLLCDIASVTSCAVGSTCALPHSAPAMELCTTAALHCPLLCDGMYMSKWFLCLLMRLRTHGCFARKCCGQLRLQDGGQHVDLQELQAAHKAVQVDPNAMVDLTPSFLLFCVSANAGDSRVGLQQDGGIMAGCRAGPDDYRTC